MNKIKYWRIERQFTQIELALAAGLPRYKIQQFELGINSPNQDEISQLALAMGLEERDLALKKALVAEGGSCV